MSVQQEELLRRAKAGDRDAGEALVVGNSGLIWSIARRYFGQKPERARHDDPRHAAEADKPPWP